MIASYSPSYYSANRFSAVIPPRFAGKRDNASELSKGWREPEVRARLRKVLEQGMLQYSPQLTQAFLRCLDTVCGSNAISDASLYKELAGVFQQYAHYVRPHFEREEAHRNQRRLLQIIGLLPNAARPTSYVDIGCGNGSITTRLARHWKLSPENAVGLEVCVRPDKDNGIDYRAYDGKTLPLKSRGYDLPTLLMVLHHAENPQGLLKEANRVLKPGGRLIIRECDAGTPPLRLFNKILDQLYYQVFEPLPDVPMPGNYRGAAEWRKLFMQAGFVVEREIYPEPESPVNPVHFVLRKI